MNYSKIILENNLRLNELNSEYDPIRGIGSPLVRRGLRYSLRGQENYVFLPEGMFFNPLVEDLQTFSAEELIKRYSGGIISEFLISDFEKGFTQIRFYYDFEYWAFSCVKINDKITAELIPFKLNRAQRKLLKKLEEMRLKNVPIRVILLKARQWGGSTLTQVYMAWIQLIHKKNWSSAIVADVDDQARNIRGMYDKLVENYPPSAGKFELKPYQGSTKNKIIDGQGGIIGVGSVQKPDNLRSYAFNMIHMSEVGLWQDTPKKSAEDLAQSLRAGIPKIPYTLVVLESTAKGVGNFFHREYQAACTGESGYEPVFIPWWLIEIYQYPIEEPIKEFLDAMTEYHWFLWELGATLEGINWYKKFKKDENYSDWRMMSEYPSTDTEAFQSTGHRAFAPLYILNARKTCMPPEMVGDVFGSAQKGEDALRGVEFSPMSNGNLWIWALPDHTIDVANRYCEFVDIGGRTDNADFSVIKVFDRYWMLDNGVPEVVAVWYGHLDQDLVAWKAAQIGKLYRNALVAVETNSLRKEETEGDHFLTILDEIVPFYPNIFARTDPEKVRQGLPVRYGFHSDIRTKPMIIDTLNAALRDRGYIERDLRACDEMDSYETKNDGRYGAVEGMHDDHVVVTAGGVWLALSYMPAPKLVESKIRIIKPIRKESSF